MARFIEGTRVGAKTPMLINLDRVHFVEVGSKDGEIVVAFADEHAVGLKMRLEEFRNKAA